MSKVNVKIPLPDPPGPWVNEKRCLCGDHRASYERSTFGVTYAEGQQLLREENGAAELQGSLPNYGSPSDPSGGFRSRGPVLWAMRVIKMRRWYAAHASCSGAWEATPDPERDLDRYPLTADELWTHAVAGDLDDVSEMAIKELDDPDPVLDLLAELRGEVELGEHPLARVLLLDHGAEHPDDRVDELRRLLPDLADELPHVIDPSGEPAWLSGVASKLGAESTLDELLESLEVDWIPF